MQQVHESWSRCIGLGSRGWGAQVPVGLGAEGRVPMGRVPMGRVPVREGAGEVGGCSAGGEEAQQVLPGDDASRATVVEDDRRIGIPQRRHRG